MSGIVVTLLVFSLAYTVCVAQEGRCGHNEVWKSCGTACPVTCRNRNNPPEACITVCVNGCFCKNGYIRDERTRRCVRPNQCPIQ